MTSIGPVSGPALLLADWRSLVTTGELAIMPGWQESPIPAQKADTRPFFDLLDQMESLLATIDLDWPEDERADAYRRLSRLTRALRFARETRERYGD